MVLLFSLLALSTSLWLHGLQHTRLPCPSPSSEFAQTHVHRVSDAIQLCHLHHPFLFLPSIFLSIRVFSNESALCIRWPKFWSFSFSISPSSEYSGLISFRINWFDILVIWGTLKSLLQHHSSKTSILWHSAFFMVQLSHLYVTTGKKTIALTIWTFLGKVTSLLFNILSRCVIAFHPTSILWGSGCTGSRIFCHLEFIWFQSVNVVSLGYAILLNIVTHSLPSCFSFSYLLDPCSREKQHYALIKVNFVSLPLFFNWFLHPLLWSTQQRGWRGE